MSETQPLPSRALEDFTFWTGGGVRARTQTRHGQRGLFEVLPVGAQRRVIRPAAR